MLIRAWILEGTLPLEGQPKDALSRHVLSRLTAHGTLLPHVSTRLAAKITTRLESFKMRVSR
jgi:hypothetical protein